LEEHKKTNSIAESYCIVHHIPNKVPEVRLSILHIIRE